MNVDLSIIPTWALVIIAVLGIAQLALDVVALVDLYRRPTERVTFENKWIWVAIILFVSTIGAILYLATGRKPAPVAQGAAPAAPSVASEDVADALYGPDKDTDKR